MMMMFKLSLIRKPRELKNIHSIGNIAYFTQIGGYPPCFIRAITIAIQVKLNTFNLAPDSTCREDVLASPQLRDVIRSDMISMSP